MKRLLIKTHLVFLVILLSVPFNPMFCQINGTVKVKEDSLILITQTRLDTLKSILISRDLKFHSGDDSIWAKKDFDDSHWTNLKVNFKISDLVNANWEGIGWFRKKFKIDSSLYNKAVAFVLLQNGASEIYLNGKLIKSFGTIRSGKTNEERYNSQNTPFIAVFDSSSVQVVAIRYSDQKARKFAQRYPMTAGDNLFTLWVKTADYAITAKINNLQFIAEYIFIFAFFIAFTILHLLLFFFYSRGKENLYFALFTASVALLEVTNILFFVSHSGLEIFLLFQISGIALITLAMVGYVFFLYAIFYNKMPRQFWLIVGLGALIGFISMSPFGSKWFVNYVLFPFILLLAAESLRVIFLAIKRKKRNSLIIGIGVIIFFFSIILIPIISIIPNLTPNDMINWILSFIGFISLPFTMSIYLARESAKTKADLENQLVQVQELSGKAIEQEKREAELRIENAKKELELQKAAELKLTYENLEAAHQKLKSTQSQLIQSEKMASLGELTAGIAHEIQNPLNFVNNFSEVNKELIEEMKAEIEKGNFEEVKALVIDIESNEVKINHHGKRADAIVKGMLQHSRSSSGVKEPTDINALADEYLRLSYHGLRAKDKSFNATLKTDFDVSIGKINIIPQDIGRVILNLLTNAFYAVTEKKKLNIEGYEPVVTISTKQIAGKIEIKVGDNGNGIPQKILDKIFQPFFTTKPTGQGTGLGLSISYDIITKGHGGELTFETRNISPDNLSEKEEGTCFTIRLPIN